MPTQRTIQDQAEAARARAPWVVALLVTLLVTLLGAAPAAAEAPPATTAPPEAPPEATPERGRAWFDALKGALGKRAKLGRTGLIGEQPSAWFEDRAQPKNPKAALPLPAPLLGPLACASDAPSADAAARGEALWWLLDNPEAPIALELGFGLPTLWRYDADQGCLVRWQPDPGLEAFTCQVGLHGPEVLGELDPRRIKRPAWMEGLPALNEPPCAEAEDIARVELEFIGERFDATPRDPTRGRWPKADEATGVWSSAAFSLPVIGPDGAEHPMALAVYIISTGTEEVLAVSKPPHDDGDGALILPTPLFVYDTLELPGDDPEAYSGEALHLSALLFRGKAAGAPVTLQVNKFKARYEIVGRDRTDWALGWVSYYHRWDPHTARFVNVGKRAGDDKDEGSDNSTELRGFQQLPLGEGVTLSYRARVTDNHNTKEECYKNDYGDEGCHLTIHSTRHSAEVDWLLSVRGQEVNLGTIKPKAVVD